MVAGNAPWATWLWTGSLALSSLIVMLTMPALGAYADLRRAKKRLLAWSTVGCVLATAALSQAGAGDLGWAVVAIVLSNLFFAWGESLVAAFLPELARRDSLGRVSGWGWSFGYFGGMLSLGLCLAHVLSARAAGQTAAQFVPVTMWITAGVFALACLPTFLLAEGARCRSPQAQRPGRRGLSASLAAPAQPPGSKPSSSPTSAGCWPAQRPTRPALPW